MKEYFSHDYNARDDEKMPKLLSEVGYEGYGIYWAVVEMLYKNDGYMQLDCKSIAFALHCDSICLTKVINDFDLFINDNGRFYSESVLKRLGIREEISKKRSNAAKIKWNASAEQKQNKSNAIKEKENKENDIKINEIKSNTPNNDNNEDNVNNEKQLLRDQVFSFSKYSDEMLNKFFEYWTRIEANGKMKFQNQDQFMVGMRLATWKKFIDKKPKKTTLWN